MAKRTIGGTFTATGQSSAVGVFYPAADLDTESRSFNASLWGTFVGTVQVERTLDGGATWLPCTNLGASVTFTAPMSEVLNEPQQNAGYRFNCTAFTSGTINYLFSQ